MNTICNVPDVLVKCIHHESKRVMCENAVALCLTSKVFNQTINSDAFFLSFSGVKISNTKPFIHRYIDLRCSFENHTVMVPSENVSMVMNGSNLEMSTKLFNVRSKEFLIVCDGLLSIFKADAQECLLNHEIKGDVGQLDVVDNYMYLVTTDVEEHALLLIDLKSIYNSPIVITLPKSALTPSICVGKHHVIYISSVCDEDYQLRYQMHYCMADDLKLGKEPVWIKIEGEYEEIKFFTHFDDFLLVSNTGVSKLSIDGHSCQTHEITRDMKVKSYMHFHDERLFYIRANRIFAYDLVTEKLNKICSIPLSESIKKPGAELYKVSGAHMVSPTGKRILRMAYDQMPQSFDYEPLKSVSSYFLSSSNKVYYLSKEMCFNKATAESKVNGRLTTLTFKV